MSASGSDVRGLVAAAFTTVIAGCAGTGGSTVTTPFLECMKQAETAENRERAVTHCHYDQIERRANRYD